MIYKVEIIKEAADFILSLPIKMQAKIQRTINLLKEFGYSLPAPHSKKIKNTDKLYELRIKSGSDICRLFYFHLQDKIYVITSGYIKKSNKLDKKEINRAIYLMKIFKDTFNG